MKSYIIVTALLLVPTLAYAFSMDHKWSENYEGVAGGSAQDASLAGPVCDVAEARAHAAAKNVCQNDPYGYGSKAKPGTKIGQIETPCTCQCVDNVCICTDKLEIVCFNKGE
jgi:hypothetical protein